ncbi:hypothetical protein BDR03DRAFT_987456 [Suillus americanus]|nr:hypothetical protein BDR03DRAFT_987456 [Suillus americanus]
MSLPNSPYSECSTISMEFEWTADPTVVKMLVVVLTCRHGILHYHAQTAELTTFQWPTDRYGRKIHPSQFEGYCKAHTFRYPCCLCATDALLGYVRGNMSQSAQPAVAGTWASGLLRDEGGCANLMTSVNIDKYFGRSCVPAVYYPRRDGWHNVINYQSENDVKDVNHDKIWCDLTVKRARLPDRRAICVRSLRHKGLGTFRVTSMIVS